MALRMQPLWRTIRSICALFALIYQLGYMECSIRSEILGFLNDYPYSGVDSSFGIDLDVLKALQTEWVTDFNWETEQVSMNQFNHYTTPIENLRIHFVHEKSAAPNAIPLLFVHGLPGSFLEFAPIIDQLTKEATTFTGKPVSFDVIIPSLPGFAFSSPPPLNWTITDTARIL